jgi:phosphohistidine phosphatase SixA
MTIKPLVATIVLPTAVLAVAVTTGIGTAAGGATSPSPQSSRAGTTREPTAAVADAVGERLRDGGYVVYFRRASTDMSTSDSTDNLADCTLQRNLNVAGRADARAIGREWRRLRLPVGTVLSSRYCRARDTARLAFGRFTPSTDITALPPASPERARPVGALRRLLAQRPARGSTILVAHQYNIDEATGISLDEGEAAIFEPRGGRGFRLVAKIKPRAWAQLRP